MLVPKYELFLEYTEKTQNQELQTLLTGATRSHQKRVEKRVPYTFSILINFYMSKYKLPLPTFGYGVMIGVLCCFLVKLHSHVMVLFLLKME